MWGIFIDHSNATNFSNAGRSVEKYLNPAGAIHVDHAFT